MLLHLLLTSEISKSKPEACKVVVDFGYIRIPIDGKEVKGQHCIIEGSMFDIVAWLKSFNGFIKGSDAPIHKKFSFVHINDSLL
jgi:hypothetical protein